MKTKTALTVVAWLVLCGNAAWATDYTWSGSGNWSTSSNWTSSGGTYPNGSTDNVFINTGNGNVTIDGSYTVNGFTFSVGGRNVTTTTTGTYTLNILGTLTKSSTSGNYLRDQSATQMTVNIGSVYQSNGVLYLGDASEGLTRLTINSGVILTAGTLNFNIANDYSVGTISLSGTSAKAINLINSTGTAYSRTVTTSGISSSGTGTTTISGSGSTASSGTHAATLIIDTASNATTTALFVDGTGGTLALVKQGTGTQTLSGTSTYTGGTTVSNGELVAAATSALGIGNITVGSNGLLTLAVADSIADTASLYLTFNSLVNLNFTGTETLTSLFVDGNVLSIGTYTADQLNSYFSASIFSGTGLLSVTSVPEPSALALGICSISFLLWNSRRRRND